MDINQNFFELFQLPMKFDIDQGRLLETYRDLQKQLHPDRFVNATDREKRLSMQWASYLNEGLQTLKSPFSRAVYLLKLHGHEVDLETNTAMSPEFLFAQIELREELEKVPSASDPEKAIDRFNAHVDEEITTLQSQFKSCINGTIRELPRAEDTVRKLIFLDRIKQEADRIEQKLFDE